jgi:predicted sulfurtransferase
MKHWRLVGITAAIVVILSLGAGIIVPQIKAQAVPRITIKRVKAIMDNPGVVIIDVRRSEDWEFSSSKIAGAHREDSQKVRRWMSKYGKDKTLVFYCA